MQSIPDCTVAGWWAHETPQDEYDLDNTYRGDETNTCIKYGRCSATRTGGASRNSASRGSSNGSGGRR